MIECRQLLEEIEELQMKIQEMEAMYEDKLKESEMHIRSKQQEYISVPKTKETVDIMTKKLMEKGVRMRDAVHSRSARKLLARRRSKCM